MFYLSTDKARAILFFGNEGVVKELQYSEFEALLDGFVPMEEWSGRTVRAAYVEINNNFCVVSAVFFVVTFDPKGGVDASWNLPLADLARTAAKGPDMGAGPIHLACASHCPIAFYQNALWDPDMKSHSSHFAQIKKSLKGNRLGIVFKPAEPKVGGGFSEKDAQQLEQRLTQQLGKHYEQELRDHMAQLLKDQRLRISTLTSDKEAALKELRLEYAQKMETLQQQLDERERMLADADKRNQELKATIDGQVQKIEGLREYFEHKLQRVQGSEQESIEVLKAQYEIESEAKLTAATAELNDLLKMKEVELLYRAEHEEALQQEVARLRQENQALTADSGDQILEKLSRKGVNFVTYQTGAGHITIPLSEVGNFIDNPMVFTAAYCGVSEKHYLAWLNHYQMPVCSALNDAGEACCADIPRIGSPAEFILGDSEFCQRHNPLRRNEPLKVVKG